jgi:hypothetical protein
VNANNVAHHRTRPKESKPCGGTQDWLLGEAMEITNDQEKGTQTVVGLWTYL